MKKYLVLIIAAVIVGLSLPATAQLSLNGNVTPTLQYILDANGVPTALQVSTSTISTVGIAGSNSDTFTVGVTNNTALLTTDSTNIGVFKCADATGAADCTFDTTGAGAIVIGSADVTSITLTTDSTGTAEVVLPLQSVAGAEMLNDTVDGAQLADTITLDAALGITGNNVTMTGGVVTVAGDEDDDLIVSPPTSNGNAGARNQIIGIPRIKMVGLGLMTNGAAAGKTVLTDIGDSETPATDWTAVDGDTTMSDDATVYRQGTASLKMAVAATADATDGCVNTLATGNQDWTDDESVGFWFYSDSVLTAGDLVFSLVDSVGGEELVNLPAYATANTWQWVELNIGGIANGDKDVITDVGFQLSAAGAAVAAGGAFNVYIDFVVKWDATEEEAAGVNLLADGVLSVTQVDATSGGATTVDLVEYTDYFVNYQSGNDVIVTITDLSGVDRVGLALVAY